MNVATSNLDRFFARLATLGGSSTPATGALVPSLIVPQRNTQPQSSTTPIASQSSTVSVSDGARLRASLFDLRTVVNRINTSAEVAGILTTNTNSNLTGTVDDDSKAVGTNSVTITQKAQAQRLQSGDLPEGALVGTGSLSVQFGSYNAALNNFTPGRDAPKSVAIGVLDSTIDGVTNAVNRANIGVTAKVLQDGSAAKIELTGSTSGREQAFKVTASDSAPPDTVAVAAQPVAGTGEATQAAADTSLLEAVAALPGSTLATRTDLDLTVGSPPPAVATLPATASAAPAASSPPPGLSRLAFDPTAQASDGKSLSLIDTAQDVIGSVNGEAFTGSSNQVADVLPGATLQVAATGSGTIQFRRDPDQALGSARTLVDSFNQYRAQTNGSGGVVAQQLDNKLSNALADAEGRAGNDRRTLAEIGVERSNDGSLKLNEEKFKQSLAQNSESTVAVIEDAATRFAKIADDALNGVLKPAVPGAAGSSGTSGLRTSSSAANDFFAAQVRVQQFQTLPNIKPSLITYTPTTSNLYGLAQYLAIGGL